MVEYFNSVDKAVENLVDQAIESLLDVRKNQSGEHKIEKQKEIITKLSQNLENFTGMTEIHELIDLTNRSVLKIERDQLSSPTGKAETVQTAAIITSNKLGK